MVDTRVGAVADELLAVLPLLNRIVGETVRRETGEETTMPQFRALALLAQEPHTLSALARKRRVSLQSMGTLVQTLVERGLVTRTPDPQDRRQQWLEVTELGRASFGRAQEQTVRQLVPLLETLSAAELDAVLLALPALHRVLNPHPDEP